MKTTLQSHMHVSPLCVCWQVYVLADTSYNPLSIDEVAAAHVKADCVVSLRSLCTGHTQRDETCQDR